VGHNKDLARPWNAEIRVLRSNTVQMRLVGALAATFLFRGKSKPKRVFKEWRKGQGSWVEWCRKWNGKQA